MIKRNELTDIEWQRIEPYLPPQKPKTGRPARGGGKKGVRRLSTKVHCTAEGNGKPLHFILTPGQEHEMTVFEPLVRGGGIKRQGQGRPKVRSTYLAGDKAYSSEMARNSLRSRGSHPRDPVQEE